jgi:alpha-beta hydrolase superfamily lysophospholipase
MMFFPTKDYELLPEQIGLGYENVSLREENGPILRNWFLKAREQKGVVLFLHGNAGNISHRLFKAKGWLDHGYSVFLLDYRGYGASEGKITHQNDVIEDAKAALDWLISQRGYSSQEITLHGESLGSFPATTLATKQKFKALILEAPFTSFDDMRKKYYPYVPAFVMKDFQFSNFDMIDKLQTPLFLMHGTEDDVVPFSMGKGYLKKRE